MYHKRDSVQSALSDGQRESVGRRGTIILSIIMRRDCSDDMASFARVYELSFRDKANVPKNVTFWQPLSTTKMEVIIYRILYIGLSLLNITDSYKKLLI